MLQPKEMQSSRSVSLTKSNERNCEDSFPQRTDKTSSPISRYSSAGSIHSKLGKACQVFVFRIRQRSIVVSSYQRSRRFSAYCAPSRCAWSYVACRERLAGSAGLRRNGVFDVQPPLKRRLFHALQMCMFMLQMCTLFTDSYHVRTPRSGQLQNTRANAKESKATSQQITSMYAKHRNRLHCKTTPLLSFVLLIRR